MEQKKLSPDESQRALGLAIFLHGRLCKYCGRKDRPLELDHVDGNPKNNPPDGSNWAPACGPCNKEKGPHGHRGKRGIRVRGGSAPPSRDPRHIGNAPVYKSVYVGRGEGDGEETAVRTIGAELLKNQQCEPEFRKYCMRLVEEEGVVSKSDIIIAGCEYAGVSIVTGKRYYPKLVSRAGPLEEFQEQEGAWYVRMKVRSVLPPRQAQNTAASPENRGNGTTAGKKPAPGHERDLLSGGRSA